MTCKDSMNLRSMRVLIPAALVGAALMIPLIMQQRRLADFRGEVQSLRKELTQIERLVAEKEALSNELSQLRYNHSLSREQFYELMRLRGEIGTLKLAATNVETPKGDEEKNPSQAEWSTWVSAVRANGVRPTDVPYLIQALTNESPAIRLEATKTLRLIGLEMRVNTNLTTESKVEWRRASELAVPNLLNTLSDSDVLLRANAAITLGFLGVQSGLVVPALVDRLGDPEPRVAQSAAKALGRFQNEAHSAVPDLLRVSSGDDEGLRKAAFLALQQIAPERFENPPTK